ncbi:MAG: DUF6242 domain-containing protein [Prevotellaceae bacterium]|jgi:hypothetical protein|nr:DUF6242 domain-containing protein [Prevotellaceae bacterium]
MKKIFRNVFIVALISTLFASCLGDNNDSEYKPTNPTIAPFVSLKFVSIKSDSLKNQEKANFVLQYQQPEQITFEGATINVDSLIVNLDSLPKDTRIDTVIANFLFNQYPHAAYAIYTDNFERKLLNGNNKDTLNFTRPMIVEVVSYDEQHKFYFRVKVNVHRVIPYLYNFVHTSENIAGQNVDNQFATILDNQFFYYINYQNDRFLYNANTSYANLINASSRLANLPPSADLQSIKFFNGKLFLFSKNDNKIYSTTDGYAWSAADFPISGYEVISLIMNYQNKLWGIVKDADDCYSAFSDDGTIWQIGALLPNYFPVEKFAAVPNSNHIGKPKAFVYGGLTKDGAESIKAFSTEDGLMWISIKPLYKYPLLSTGMSIVNYDNKLMMFGGKVDTTFVQVSIDEGFSWDKVDTASIKLPKDFTLRTFQSTFVDAQNRIVIVGGKDTTNNSLSDIWTIKLNSIDWEK